MAKDIFSNFWPVKVSRDKGKTDICALSLLNAHAVSERSMDRESIERERVSVGDRLVLFTWEDKEI